MFIGRRTVSSENKLGASFSHPFLPPLFSTLGFSSHCDLTEMPLSHRSVGLFIRFQACPSQEGQAQSKLLRSTSVTEWRVPCFVSVLVLLGTTGFRHVRANAAHSCGKQSQDACSKDSAFQPSPLRELALARVVNSQRQTGTGAFLPGLRPPPPRASFLPPRG